MLPAIHFLLVPDSGAARRLRRVLATRAARSGCLVGTWHELLALAQNSFLLPDEGNSWDQTLHACLAKLQDAFWAESYQVAAQETAQRVELELCRVLTALDPQAGLEISGREKLAERPARHLADLLRLAACLDGVLPPHLSLLKKLLNTASAEALQNILVYNVADTPLLDRWQHALIKRLNRAAGVEPERELQEMLEQLFSVRPRAATGSALAHLQKGLYQPGDLQHAPDDSVQWLGVRDFLAEAEVAAGMVQRMLDETPGLRPAEIGVLLPDRFEYLLAVDDAFSLAGQALSGLPEEHWRRDLGREVLFHFLSCRRKPAPRMALAVCLASPLMPWTRQQGGKLARAVMDGDYSLTAFYGAGSAALRMLELLRDEDERPQDLAAALREFVSLLVADEALSEQISQAKDTAGSLYALLDEMSEIDWGALRQAASPRTITHGGNASFNQEGITIWREGHEPWRPVRYLIVLGFCEGHYPGGVGASPVFSEQDISQLTVQTGLDLLTSQQEADFKRARFRRQLSLVSDFVVFLLPQMSAGGDVLASSDSLVFMRKLLEIDEDGALTLMLDSADDSARARFMAFNKERQATPPRALVAEDIKFEFDLLTLRKDQDGHAKPESPSGLETLMVSPLGWLLRRLHAEPLAWGPDKLEVMLLGTLAHEVFEKLFSPGETMPGDDGIARRVEAILESTIARHAPFLKSSQWKVERRKFVADTTRAARAWAQMLRKLGAEIIASEEWLQGRFKGVAIHGQADLLLALPGNRLLVVDYKRSSSGNRRERMQKGYDSQAELYRIMLETGGSKAPEHAEIAARYAMAEQTGVVYYTLNDQIALCDTLLQEASQTAGWETIEQNVSECAMAMIGQRLGEICSGRIQLNRAGDGEFFDKNSVTPYALEISPLIALFTLPEDAGEP